MLMQLEKITVAKDFNRLPYGRYPEHGANNGQRFREEFLLPALRRGSDLLVDLDGTRGLGPSFLEEAFGGLVRAGLTAAEIQRRVTVKSDDDPSYISEIQSYIDEEARRQAVSG